MRKFSFILFSLISFSIIFSGCWFIRIGIRNTGEAIFGTPEKVKNKIKDPVKDNIELSALWVGHSTVLLQISDKVILIDPLFEDVIGGALLRKVEAGLDIEDIERLDLVLVSHAHMDHMSLASIKDIDELFNGTKLVFPLGAEDYLPSYRMDMIRLNTGNSRERGYVGESKIIDGVKVTAVFAEHQGGRYGFDSYTWHVPGCTGYIIEYNGKTVFYAGDTAYDKFAYKELGKKFDIDLALIPIGPCRECDVEGSFNHVASLGALMMLDDLQADYMIPVHYGSIAYFNDPFTPVVVLKELIDNGSSGGKTEMKRYKEKVIILNAGEQYIFQFKN